MVMRKAIYWRELSWMLLLHILQTNVEAGLTKRSARIAREVYPEIEPENDANQAQVCIVGDVVYATDELVPAEQPCLKCRCQPPGVQCETIKCIKKSGCKAIHKSNKCCPDYQCECQHEGQIYANGERLKTPLGGNCKVCYCRGGEVQCAQVSCYVRTDCEGKTVPGQCCPKYDHCPPKEPLLGRPTTDLPNINKEVLELWPLTKLLQNSSEESTSPTLYETQDANKIEKESVTVENTIKITRATQTDFTDDTNKQIEEPKITIQEIIPEIKEIPITPSKFEPHSIEQAKEVDSNNDLVVTDPEPDSSEISEVFQQPPPVLRIGDKLLFLKQGELVPEKDASTPTSVITIIGAEGLQRGFEDSVEFHELPANISDNLQHTLFNNSNDLEPKTSESTHILSLVKQKKKTETTTEAITTTTEENQNTEITTTQTTITTTEQIDNTTKIPIIETTIKNTYDILLEENPAYPAIPEIMSPVGVEMSQHVDSNDTQKTAPEVVTGKTNTDQEKIEESPLLTTSLPETNDTDEEATTLTTLDLNITTETPSSTPDTSVEYVETNSTLDNHSVESMEDTTEEDSGENTTPKNDHASIVSSENASVEPSSDFKSDESIDMLKDVSPTSQLEIDIIEIIQNKTSEEDASTMKDVEVINTDNFTHIETDIKSEKLKLPAKSIEKRENSPKDETDEVFRELEAELNTDQTQRPQNADEEKEESDKIFQELLEETSTPKPAKRDRNAEAIEKVTDALAKLTLRGKKNPLDTNVLGLISNFFNPRYDRKK